MGAMITALFGAMGLGALVAVLIAVAVNRRGKVNSRGAFIAGLLVALLSSRARRSWTPSRRWRPARWLR